MIFIQFGQVLDVISSKNFFATCTLSFPETLITYIGVLDDVAQVPEALFIYIFIFNFFSYCSD